MKLKKSKFGITLLVSMLWLSGLLAGCGGGGGQAEDKPAPAPAPAPANNSSNAGADTQERVKLTLLTNNQQDNINISKALIAAYQAQNPHVTIETETGPPGSEGDNLVKTRLATGDMTDIFFYNSGSLLQALNPEQHILDLTNEPFQANVMDSFKSTVTQNGKIFGAPYASTIGGGWLYNKKIYADLGLSVPKTWAELMENNDKIKAAGIDPIIGSYKDTWSSQLIVLADYYNVQAAEPNFAEEFTANKAKFASSPAALRSFEKLESTVGYMNKDFLATTYDTGMRMLAEGKGAHYPMLTSAIPAIAQNHPDQIDDIGFFAQPGDQADKNGLTVWMPSAVYIYKNSEHIEEAKAFVNFVASVEGMAEVAKVSPPVGPYVIQGAEIPDSVPQVVKDMLPYFEAEGQTAPALEFLSPIKGPSLEQITVEVGSGSRSAKDGAALYDNDVLKQAQQLGLEGW